MTLAWWAGLGMHVAALIVAICGGLLFGLVLIVGTHIVHSEHPVRWTLSWKGAKRQADVVAAKIVTGDIARRDALEAWYHRVGWWRTFLDGGKAIEKFSHAWRASPLNTLRQKLLVPDEILRQEYAVVDGFGPP